MFFRLLLAFACLHHASCFPWSRRICFKKMLTEFSCYGKSSPYTNSEGYLPESPTKQKIQFKLFTKNNRATPDILEARSTSSVSSSHYTRNGKVAFIIHGFTDSSKASWVASLVKELLVKVPNVIAVDWEYGARGGFFRRLYPQSTANTRVVGAQIATLIKTMISAKVGVTLGNIHLIGHSLGAHVAGYAGEKFNNPKIGRITGMDPAAPNFEYYDIRVKLDPSDAAFVDVIHTSTFPLYYGGLGTAEDCGHVDFWPNGGKDMPGCPKTKPGVVPLKKNFEAGSCNHRRAYEYFTASINTRTFRAYQCTHSKSYRYRYSSRYNYMGYSARSYRPGRFCLRTRATYPF